MNILVSIDLSDSSRKVISSATQLARAFSGKVWLLHVAEPNPDFVGYEAGPQTERDAVARMFHEEHRQLQQFGDELRSSGLECVTLLVQGPTVEKILSEAAKLSADIIVVGSHGKGKVRSLLVGSTSEGVLHNSPVPVLVVPTHGRT